VARPRPRAPAARGTGRPQGGRGRRSEGRPVRRRVCGCDARVAVLAEAVSAAASLACRPCSRRARAHLELAAGWPSLSTTRLRSDEAPCAGPAKAHLGGASSECCARRAAEFAAGQDPNAGPSLVSAAEPRTTRVARRAHARARRNGCACGDHGDLGKPPRTPLGCVGERDLRPRAGSHRGSAKEHRPAREPEARERRRGTGSRRARTTDARRAADSAPEGLSSVEAIQARARRVAGRRSRSARFEGRRLRATSAIGAGSSSRVRRRARREEVRAGVTTPHLRGGQAPLWGLCKIRLGCYFPGPQSPRRVQ